MRSSSLRKPFSQMIRTYRHILSVWACMYKCSCSLIGPRFSCPACAVDAARARQDDTESIIERCTNLRSIDLRIIIHIRCLASTIRIQTARNPLHEPLFRIATTPETFTHHARSSSLIYRSCMKSPGHSVNARMLDHGLLQVADAKLGDSGVAFAALRSPSSLEFSFFFLEGNDRGGNSHECSSRLRCPEVNHCWRED